MRSLLFAPADDVRKSDRLRESAADVAVLDLEDAVAENAKADARVAAATALGVSGPWRAAVRVNGLRTPHFAADVEAVVVPGLEYLVVPKTEGLDDVRAIEAAVAPLERERGVGPVGLLALVETARGIAQLDALAAAAPARLQRFLFGSLDYAVDVGIEPSEGEPELLYARSRVTAAAAVLGRGRALDGAWFELGDDEGLAADCSRSRRLGFGGRIAIHPAQLTTIHTVYGALAADEAERLRRVVTEFERALAEGVAAIRVDDRLVDYPVYKDALRRLEHDRAPWA
jgi:citrate lyase subunit beta/citryl-CoA lyase